MIAEILSVLGITVAGPAAVVVELALLGLGVFGLVEFVNKNKD